MPHCDKQVDRRRLPHDDPLSPRRRATLRPSLAVSSTPTTDVPPMLDFEITPPPPQFLLTGGPVYVKTPAIAAAFFFKSPTTQARTYTIMPTTGSNTLGPTSLPRLRTPPRARGTSLDDVLSSPTAVPLFRGGFPLGRSSLPLDRGSLYFMERSAVLGR